MKTTNKFVAILLALVVAFGIALVPSAPPASAAINGANVSITVRSDISISNMLVSFQTPNGIVSQHYVCEGCYYGEGTSNVYWAEPQRLWINPGYCGGWRHRFHEKATGSVHYTDWVRLGGGTNGHSEYVNTSGVYSDRWNIRVEAYLIQC